MKHLTKKLKIVAVGGTFDEFHKGHRELLLKAFEVGEHVQIGVSTDDLVQKMNKPHLVATYDVRVEELKSFLRKNGVLERAEIVPLYSPYGITLTSEKLEGIVVSRETEKVAKEINEKRKAKGLHPLKVFTIDMVPAENNTPISTTRIRRLEIDREGHLLKHSRKD
ncbi:MAG: phosphopantetheine adenylyltransferase [Candidatus Bathyarchaeales archaeon]